MSSDLPTVQFSAGSPIGATPRTSEFFDAVQTAVRGGDSTFDFFQGIMTPQYRIAQAVAQYGDAAWSEIDDGSQQFSFLAAGWPACWVSVEGGSLAIQVQPSEQVMESDTTEMSQAGVATVYLTTGEGISDVIVSAIEKVGPAISAAAVLPAVKTLLGGYQTAVQSYMTTAYSKVEGGETDIDTIVDDSADEAATEATIEGEVIADEVAIDLIFSPAAVAGIALASVTLLVSVILFLLAKTMTLIFRFYNYTSSEVSLYVCFQQDLETLQEPASPTVPAIGTPSAPPGVQPVGEVVYRADYTIQNQDELGGLGFVLSGQGSPFDGFGVRIEIPSVGGNLIWTRFGDYSTSDCKESIWHGVAGEFSQLVVGDDYFGSHGDPGYTITIATNQLSGQSPSPVTGQKGYYYEFVVVLAEQSLVEDE